MNNAELIKALRETDFGYVCEHCEHEDMCRNNDCVIIQAADALEAADKRIAELEAKMPKLPDRQEFLAKGSFIEEPLSRPKEGEWTTKRTWDHDGEIYCSVCDHDAPTEGDYRQVKTNYCPNCGAKMRGEHDEQIH